MIKTVVVVCTLCVAAGGTLIWASSSGAKSRSLALAASTMPSITELTAKAGPLPDTTVYEAF